MRLFRENTAKDGEAVNRFCKALKDGDADGVEKQFTEYLKKTVSIRDTFVRKPTKENFYHGILLGILGFKASWAVSSNRETGEGYSDIQVEIEDEEIGIVIEVKYAQNADLETECQKAFCQMEAMDYVWALREDGMRIIRKYAIACYKKRCKVMVENDVQADYV